MKTLITLSILLASITVQAQKTSTQKAGIYLMTSGVSVLSGSALIYLGWAEDSKALTWTGAGLAAATSIFLVMAGRELFDVEVPMAKRRTLSLSCHATGGSIALRF